MGLYVNPGKQRFQMALNSDIYVDQTLMITYLNSVLNTNQRYISISRPRRFGKTMAVDMVCAYYDRTTSSREIFENTKLSQNESCDDKSWDKYLQKFDVIRLVMTDVIRKDSTVSDSMNLIRKKIIAELKELYPNVSYDEEDLFYSLEKCYLKTNTQFVVVIDEWDAVFRIRKEDKEGQNFYLNFLRDLLKDKNYIALAYMTGILPIKKQGNIIAIGINYNGELVNASKDYKRHSCYIKRF